MRFLSYILYTMSEPINYTDLGPYRKQNSLGSVCVVYPTLSYLEVIYLGYFCSYVYKSSKNF
jgi:hypothetical protein